MEGAHWNQLHKIRPVAGACYLTSSQPRPGKAEGTCQGGYGQRRVGRLIHSALLEQPACSGDTEHTTAPPPAFTKGNIVPALTDSGDSQAATVNVAGQVQRLLNPGRYYGLHHRWGNGGMEEPGPDHMAGEGLSRTCARFVFLHSLGSHQLCCSWVVMWTRIPCPHVARTHSHGPLVNWSRSHWAALPPAVWKSYRLEPRGLRKWHGSRQGKKHPPAPRPAASSHCQAGRTPAS